MNFISSSITHALLLSLKLGKRAARDCFLYLLKQSKELENIKEIYNGIVLRLIYFIFCLQTFSILKAISSYQTRIDFYRHIIWSNDISAFE